MIESLKTLGDFVVDLKWDFNSWLPLVSRILPSDICKISKKGNNEIIIFALIPHSLKKMISLVRLKMDSFK